jgi:hypothetical protein
VRKYNRDGAGYVRQSAVGEAESVAKGCLPSGPTEHPPGSLRTNCAEVRELRGAAERRRAGLGAESPVTFLLLEEEPHEALHVLPRVCW